jgi:excisionase family DNA binding protein
MSPRFGPIELIVVVGCLGFLVAIGVAVALLVTRSRTAPARLPDRRQGDLPEVMTVPEVADLLRVDADAVQGLIQDGRLPAVQVGDGWRVSRANVMDFVNGRGARG